MKRYTILIAAFLLPLALGAQNLNPEVQVTNEYETRINDVAKQGPSMTVPDSMLRFDYHFDYSVFESPYKGAYEFSPYSVLITPAAGAYDGRKLYLRTGAGWVLRPELDLVWSAIDRKRAAVNVFATGRGFYGDYLKIAEDTFVADKSTLYNGWDFNTVAGVDTRFNIGKSVLRAELAYEGLFTGHQLYGNAVGHAPYAAVSLGKDDALGFTYRADLKYRYVNDRLEGNGPKEDHDVRANIMVSPYLGERLRVGFDLDFAYNKAFTGFEGHPHILFGDGAWDFDAGFRIGWYSNESDGQFTICPDLKAVWHLLDRHLDLYAGAVGKNHMLSYWDYKTMAHRYFISYDVPRPVREIADLHLGVRGFTGFGLRWDLKAGYVFIDDAPLWTVSATGGETLTFNDFGMLHADLDFAWSSKRVDVQGAVHYNWLPEGVDDRVFMPAAVRADLKASYNWMKRIYAGVSGNMSTSRSAVVNDVTVELPWYLDLGVWAEYKFNDKLGVWLKGGNILNHQVRTSPVYCQYGPSVIAGVTLSL